MPRWKGKYQLDKVGPYLYKTLSSLSYTTKKGIEHLVPKGFVTDGASIPKLFWSVVGSPFTGLYCPAALIDDYFYYTKSTSRWYADKIFLECMKDLGVSKWKRVSMWFAVRIGAGRIWKRRRKGCYYSRD